MTVLTLSTVAHGAYVHSSIYEANKSLEYIRSHTREIKQNKKNDSHDVKTTKQRVNGNVPRVVVVIVVTLM